MNEYKEYLEDSGEYGVVNQTRHPLVFAEGLPGARLDELVVFEEGQLGYVMSMYPNRFQIALLSSEPVKPGMKLTRTMRKLHIPISTGQRGKIIDPLGKSIIEGEKLSGGLEQRPIDIQPLSISHRLPISKQLVTGTSIVDLLVPLASGQREAIIGDLKTGKTSFLLAAAKAHSENGLVVYAGIGRPRSELRRIADFMKEQTKQENVIMVVSDAEDVPSLITITPYSAMTIAEYWRDQGEDVLLILHDLSTHARYYREVALLAERFPGRESYPGDIFHAHARLLERGGNFKVKNDKEASITCLVVGETVQSEVSGYIVSNLISITDGHLLFDSVRFSEGQRPAVDVAGSVTRVGRKVQPILTKQLYLKLIALLTKYEQAQQFSKFGTELSDDLKETLVISERILKFLSQPSFLTVPLPAQTALVGMIWQGWLNEEGEEAPGMWRDRIVQHYNGDKKIKGLIDGITETDKLKDFVKKLDEHKEELVNICQSETL